MNWVIHNVNTGDYWNNQLGWTEYPELADIYTDQEKREYGCPLEGRWQQIDDQEHLQKVIASLEADGSDQAKDILQVVRARLQENWDDPGLQVFGAVTADVMADIWDILRWSRVRRVDVIASGYEWTCPLCNYFNKEVEWTEVLVCFKCGRGFEAGEPEHAWG